MKLPISASMLAYPTTFLMIVEKRCRNKLQ